MAETLQRVRFNWVWLRRFSSPVFIFALTVGTLLHFGGFFFFRVISTTLPIQEQRAPFVGYVSTDLLGEEVALEEQAILFDSAPLFIPTKWNATRVSLDMGRDLTSDGFSAFVPEFTVLEELQPKGLFELELFEVEQPSDLLASRFIPFFSILGQSVDAPVALPKSGSVAVIRALGDAAIPGRSETIREIPAELNFEGSAFVSRPVRVELLLSGAGIVLSGPRILEGSGDAQYDAAVMVWLENPSVHAQLPSGFLQIEVYP